MCSKSSDHSLVVIYNTSWAIFSALGNLSLLNVLVASTISVAWSFLSGYVENNAFNFSSGANDLFGRTSDLFGYLLTQLLKIALSLSGHVPPFIDFTVLDGAFTAALR